MRSPPNSSEPIYALVSFTAVSQESGPAVVMKSGSTILLGSPIERVQQSLQLQRHLSAFVPVGLVVEMQRNESPTIASADVCAIGDAVRKPPAR
jgi:hypothetical protein